MPPLTIGKRYSFTTTAGRLEAELVEVGSDWLTLRLAKGDRGWFRLSTLLAITETECARTPK
jgi:hypothetical protein